MKAYYVTITNDSRRNAQRKHTVNIFSLSLQRLTTYQSSFAVQLRFPHSANFPLLLFCDDAEDEDTDDTDSGLRCSC